jgi:uncharacterized protein YdbL (DUF1318 family)
MKRLWAFLAAAAMSGAGAAQPSLVGSAIQSGQVGERYDGYMGFVSAPSEALRRQVAAINLRRRNLYIELASRRNVSADVVGLTAACELLGQLPFGRAYMLKDNVWRTRAPGQPPPLPSYCR